MPPEALVTLYMAGVMAGTVSVLVSLASLISYPALLAVGLPPVAANVTNTVSLVFTGIGAGLGSRRELVGQRPVIARLAIAGLIGGASGAALLLVLPEWVFERVAPLLIAGASVLLLLQPRLKAMRAARTARLSASTAAAYGATAVYTGYFGAAGGILAFVALTRVIDRPFHDVNAAKNLLAAVSNGAAAVVFILVGPVYWLAVLPLAAGLFTGGLIGPSIARRVPATVLRVVVAVCGLGVAAALAWNSYR
ncbi:MAG TPA: sulfite exporter TauE/SafE family protein [Candidatus Limnocylindrales bacterium]|nr:sulfite exporter TauE/SafE family protein [Candidatus Limnocylindrales bacterium]